MSHRSPPETDRPPPQNLDAEQAVLGALMVDRSIVPVVEPILDVSDFYAPHHAAIYKTLIGLYRKGEPIDKVSVAETLRARGALDAVGGLDALTHLLYAVPTTASAEYYAKIVGEKSAQRQLISAGGKAWRMGFEGEAPAAIMAALRATMEAINLKTPAGGMLLRDALEEAAKTRPERLRFGVPFGWPSLDRLVRGMKPGMTTVVAARPGVGKSSMLEQSGVAAGRVAPVLFFPLEMGRDYTVDKIAVRLQRDADMGEPKPFEGVDLRIYDNHRSWSVADIWAQVEKHKPAIVMLDHLRWVDGWRKKQPGERSDEAAMRTMFDLVQMAMQARIHLLAAHQINRECKGRPTLDVLRDTGAVEELAWRVFLLYRPGRDEPENDVTTEVIVAKNRVGFEGLVTLAWHKATASLFDIPSMKLTDPPAERRDEPPQDLNEEVPFD